MFQCPSCKEDNLYIIHTVRCTTAVNREEEVEDYDIADLEYSGRDEAGCNDCGWSGTVKNMTVEEFIEVV